MKNKKIILAAAIVGVVLAGAGSVIAMKPLWNQDDPEAGKLAQLMGSGKLKAKDIDALTQMQAERDVWSHMTPEERSQVQAKSLEKFRKDQAANPTSNVAPAASTANPFIGVLAAKDAPMPPAGYNDFRTFGYWGGMVSSGYMGVRAGAAQKSPQQGAVLVSDATTGVGANIYNTPSATGPVEIVSEANGVLVLHSIAVSVDVYDEVADRHTTVATQGGTTYTFDTKTRTFVK